MANVSEKNPDEAVKKLERTEKKSEVSPVAWWQPALVLFARLSVWIAGPVIVGSFLGKYLDKKFDTAPIMLISVVGFSFLISMVGLVKESAKEFKKIEEADPPSLPSVVKSQETKNATAGEPTHAEAMAGEETGGKKNNIQKETQDKD